MAHLIEKLIEKYNEEGLDITKLACVFFDTDSDGRRVEVWDEGSSFRNEHFIDNVRFYISPQLRNLEGACNRVNRQLDDEGAEYSWAPNTLYESADCPWTRGDSFNPQFN
jgi:hypothetical protein|tara:strand:+ start:105 stop:434 length:330 start_codon:yes stop_codon:yes gene_type:complete